MPASPLAVYGTVAFEEFETADGPADYAVCDGGRVHGVAEAFMRLRNDRSSAALDEGGRNG